MVRLVLASVKRPMVRPTGGATSPAGHHQDPFFFSLFQTLFYGFTVGATGHHFDFDDKYG